MEFLSELPWGDAPVGPGSDVDGWGLGLFDLDARGNAELQPLADHPGDGIPSSLDNSIHINEGSPQHQHAPPSSSGLIHPPSTPNDLEDLLGPLVPYNRSQLGSAPLAELNNPFLVGCQAGGDPHHNYQQHLDQNHGPAAHSALCNGVSYTMTPLPVYAPPHYFESASPIMVRWGPPPHYSVTIPGQSFSLFGDPGYLVPEPEPEPEHKELNLRRYYLNDGYAQANPENSQPCQRGQRDAGESSAQGSQRGTKNEEVVPPQYQGLIGVKRPSIEQPKTLGTVTDAGFVCKECGLTFPAITVLNKHYRSHMGVQADKPGVENNPLTNCHCPICPATVTNPGSLKGHLAMHLSHPEELTPELSAIAEAHCSGKSLERCDQCPFVVNRPKLFHQHQQTHLEGYRVHRCGRCGITLTSPHTAAQHQRLHKDGRVLAGGAGACRVAGVIPDAQDDEDFSAMDGSSEIPTEEGSNSGRAGYDCRVCGANLTTRKLRRAHYAAHRQYSLETAPREDTVFPCTVCGETFTGNHLLKRHAQTHATGPSKEKSNKRKRGGDKIESQDPADEDIDGRQIEAGNGAAEPSRTPNMSQPERTSGDEGAHHEVGDIINGPQQLPRAASSVSPPAGGAHAEDLEGKERAVLQ